MKTWTTCYQPLVFHLPAYTETDISDVVKIL